MKSTLFSRSPIRAATGFAILLTLSCAPAPAYGARGDCGQPVSNGSGPVSTDCLFILNAALALTTCDPQCVCELNGSPPVTSTDALVCLNVAIGNPPPFFPSCPCEGTTSTSMSGPTTTTTTLSTTTSTTLPMSAACGAAQSPECNGGCPAEQACLPVVDGCACQPMRCGEYRQAGSPLFMCHGLCPQDSACVDIDETCLCVPSETPCGDAAAPQCDGACPDESFCLQTGEGCSCAPVGCGQYAPAPTCLGICASDGQVCVNDGGTCVCAF